MWRIAQRLSRRNPRRNPQTARLPPLLLFTDPDRTPDPVAAARRLPAGAGVVFRHFGLANAEDLARALARTARERRLVLLIGDDPALAAAVGASGVHLPERSVGLAPRLRLRRPGWLITGAAHSAYALRRAEAVGVNAVVLSAVFPSRSRSAAAPLGGVRAARMAQNLGVPVYALGGVDATTAKRLVGSRLWGLAAIEALSGSSTGERPARPQN